MRATLVQLSLDIKKSSDALIEATLKFNSLFGSEIHDEYQPLPPLPPLSKDDSLWIEGMSPRPERAFLSAPLPPLPPPPRPFMDSVQSYRESVSGGAITGIHPTPTLMSGGGSSAPPEARSSAPPEARSFVPPVDVKWANAESYSAPLPASPQPKTLKTLQAALEAKHKRCIAAIEEVLRKYRELGMAKAQEKGKLYTHPVLVPDFIYKLVLKNDKDAHDNFLPDSREEFLLLLFKVPKLVHAGKVKRKSKNVDAFILT